MVHIINMTKTVRPMTHACFSRWLISGDSSQRTSPQDDERDRHKRQQEQQEDHEQVTHHARHFCRHSRCFFTNSDCIWATRATCCRRCSTSLTGYSERPISRSHLGQSHDHGIRLTRPHRRIMAAEPAPEHLGGLSLGEFTSVVHHGASTCVTSSHSPTGHGRARATVESASCGLLIEVDFRAEPHTTADKAPAANKGNTARRDAVCLAKSTQIPR